jgi:hypothetical protein
MRVIFNISNIFTHMLNLMVSMDIMFIETTYFQKEVNALKSNLF